jgi:hypothetical protein
VSSWFFFPKPGPSTSVTPAPEQTPPTVPYPSLDNQREREELGRLADLLRQYPDLAERIRDALELPDE